MNKSIAIIKNSEEFNELRTLVNEVINIELRLPDQVFQKCFSSFLFEEFDWAMSADFWQMIQRLAMESKDSYILVAVIEPSPIDYFYKEFGYFSWFKLPVNMSPEDYWSVLEFQPKDSPADALLFNSDIVVWVSPSKKWAIWGERRYGICILALNDVNAKSQLLGAWWSVDDALRWIIPQSFSNKSVPLDFINSLRVNYLIKPSAK